ncbi:MAG: ABC transporter permease, partial [Candidatus Aminicenantales bacterium]
MKKFANLLKKEIKELVTKQLVFTLLFMVVIYNFIGQVSKKEVQKIVGVQTISALDEDGSAGSQALLKGLESARYKIIDQSGKTKEQAIEASKANDSKLLVVIPKGFGDSLTELKPSEIETYSFMRTFSLIGARGQIVVDGVISALNNVISNNFLKAKLPEFDPQSLKKPIKSKDYVVVRDHVAEGKAMDVAGMMSQQSLLIPIVLMMIVIYSSQMVISAVAMEKQNKTLETLLTVPIKRTSIITAKMLAAGLVGLISAGVYMFAFKGFVGGMT